MGRGQSFSPPWKSRQDTPQKLTPPRPLMFRLRVDCVKCFSNRTEFIITVCSEGPKRQAALSYSRGLWPEAAASFHSSSRST